MARANPEEVAKKVRDALEAFGRHDLEPWLAMLHPDYEVRDSNFPEPVKGKDVIRKLNEGLFEAIPDLGGTVLSVAASGDVVAVEGTMSGTFTAPLRFPQGSIPPTGRHFEFAYAAFYRFNSEGLLTESRNYGTDLRQQLGINT